MFFALRAKNKRPAGKTCEPSGGLLWIDQEVVTLRGLFGNSGLLTDLRQADSILTHRKYAGCSLRFRYTGCITNSKAPLRATSL